nr:Os07g0208533 [Ipomoea batatas]GMD28821.1 Os07g0208533 [Ipomoea batatas]
MHIDDPFCWQPLPIVLMISVVGTKVTPDLQGVLQLLNILIFEGPLVLSTKGSILTHNNEKMEAKRTDHMTTMVGVLFCRPMSPLRNGYRWTMTQKAKNSFPNSGPHDWDPLLMASEIPATTPTKLMIRMVVGGISSVVHLKVYSSPNSSSSTALEVTVKFVSIPASTFSSPFTHPEAYMVANFFLSIFSKWRAGGLDILTV